MLSIKDCHKLVHQQLQKLCLDGLVHKYACISRVNNIRDYVWDNTFGSTGIPVLFKHANSNTIKRFTPTLTTGCWAFAGLESWFAGMFGFLGSHKHPPSFTLVKEIVVLLCKTLNTFQNFRSFKFLLKKNWFRVEKKREKNWFSTPFP